MAGTVVVVERLRLGQTSRRDAWWLPQLGVFVGFSTFVVYATWAALQGADYWAGNLLSPFYSPEIWGPSPHALFGPPPAWLPWPSFLPFSAAVIILAIPGNFRLTCYYYRGAYYKAFWADPPACSVGEPRTTYLGERWLPLVLQNVHRWFLYGALVVWVFLCYDVLLSMRAPGGGLQVSAGTLVLGVNVVLIWLYCTGCHSLRHLVGGRCDEFSKHPWRFGAWRLVTSLNRRHQLWAWCSLFSVGFSDVYVRLCAKGIWTDAVLLRLS